MRDLGSPGFTWHDLAVIIRHSPLSSALSRERRGKASVYDSTDYLVAGMWNTLRQMSWQLGQNAKAPKPEAIVLPGMEDKKSVRLGDAMTMEEMDRRLAKYRH